MKTRRNFFVISFIVLFLASICLYTLTSTETQAASSLFTVTATTSVSQVTLGNTIALSVKAKNTSKKTQKADVIVSLADPAGKIVYTQTWSSQSFTSGKELSFNTSYLAAVTALTGKYNVGVKLQTSATTSTTRLSLSSVYFYNPALTTFSVVAPAPAPTPTPTPAPVPASSQIYWGVYMDGVPWDMTKLTGLETSVNKGASIVHFGQPWMHNGTYYNFPTSIMETIRLHGSIPMLNWGSWDYCCGPDQSAWKLSNIYNGTYDTFIKQFAASAKAWNHPFFLRFDHEMNGYWQFPWAEQINGNQPGDFVKAWQHVHDIFTQVGATNVSWVWSPNIVGPKTTPLAAVYPGDSYVDWLGIDGYNWGLDYNNAWQTFSQVFSSTYTALAQLAPGKPMMLAEISSSENGGSKADWIQDALQTQLPVNFPMIKALVWFDCDAGDATLSWTIDSSSTSLSAFKSAIGSKYYASNTFASLSPTIIQALPKVSLS